MTREKGPVLTGGYPTFWGKAGERKVCWIARNKSEAAELELRFQAGSHLLSLMIRNAYTLEGISRFERYLVRGMIVGTPEQPNINCGGDKCCKNKAIGDTGLCRKHNLENLKKKR
jgi:hypothetical protein